MEQALPTENQTPISPVEPVQKVETVEPKKSGGFLIVLLSILLIISVLIAGFFAYQTQNLVKEITKLQVSPTTLTSIDPSPTTDPTIDWKTYTNTEYGFSFKYPENWKVADLTGSGYFSVGPTTVLNEISENLESYRVDGGYNLGKERVIIFHPEPNQSSKESNQYWEISETSIEIDNKRADKYVGINIQNTPNGEYFKGDSTTMILIPLKNDYFLDYTLLDENFTETFNQILSTFKFIEPEASNTPITSPQPSPLTN